MSEIEVGNYIRTVYGEIGKIKQINRYTDTKQPYSYTLTNNKILDSEEDFKYSKDIIDLIEVGDVIEFKKGNKVDVRNKLNGKIDTLLNYIDIDNIKTILTHEQYSANAYKVERS